MSSDWPPPDLWPEEFNWGIHKAYLISTLEGHLRFQDGFRKEIKAVYVGPEDHSKTPEEGLK